MKHHYLIPYYYYELQKIILSVHAEDIHPKFKDDFYYRVKSNTQLTKNIKNTRLVPVFLKDLKNMGLKTFSPRRIAIILEVSALGLYKTAKKLGFVFSEEDKVLAIKNDCLASSWGFKVQTLRGGFFEKRMREILKELGASFKTESDLRGGGPTPDFLFTKPFIFKNKAFNWFEVKSYFGDPFRMKGDLEQVQKYYKAFGPGGIVYLFNFSKKLQEKLGQYIVPVSFFDFLEKK
jgi:hypothetical protein